MDQRASLQHEAYPVLRALARGPSVPTLVASTNHEFQRAASRHGVNRFPPCPLVWTRSPQNHRRHDAHTPRPVVAMLSCVLNKCGERHSSSTACLNSIGRMCMNSASSMRSLFAVCNDSCAPSVLSLCVPGFVFLLFSLQRTCLVGWLPGWWAGGWESIATIYIHGLPSTMSPGDRALRSKQDA